MPAVREAVVDGLFYPAAPAALRAQVAGYLGRVDADDGHARPEAADRRRTPATSTAARGGAGLCAARRGHAPCRRVVLLGPAQPRPLEWLARCRGGVRDTPLGRVALDRRRRWPGPRRLAARSGRKRPRRTRREHSIEVQLPFLQSAARQAGFTLVPLGRRALRGRRSRSSQVLERRVGRRRDADRDQLRPSRNYLRRTSRREALDHANAQGRITGADAGLGLADEGPAGLHAINGALLGGTPPSARAAPAGPAQLRRHRGDRERVVGYGAIVFEEHPR
jgi:hypothetical protein